MTAREKNNEGVGTLTKTKSRNKREAIIKAATELFTTEGYETTTITPTD